MRFKSNTNTLVRERYFYCASDVQLSKFTQMSAVLPNVIKKPLTLMTESFLIENKLSFPL